MSAEPNNGVEVRGLRVVRRSERRRTSWWKTLVGFALGEFDDHADQWHTLTVTDAAGVPVARRRFTRAADAERARTRFVGRVHVLPGDPGDVDLQVLLDSV